MVQYLVDNALVSKIIVVDKTMPQTAWLNQKHSAVFEDAIVEYRSANLINMVSCERAFEATDDVEFVINLVSTLFCLLGFFLELFLIFRLPKQEPGNLTKSMKRASTS